MGKKAISNTFTVNTIDDAVTYGFVFTEAFAKADASKTITANIAGYAYKYVGDKRTPLVNTVIRYGYIIDDDGTYTDKTTSNSGFFDTQGWFNGDNIDDYAKGSPSIFAAIQIGGVIVHVEYITISLQGDTGGRGKTGRFYYYAQEWTNSSSPLFIVTDAQAPYFLYNNNYWVFNPEENYPNGISMSAMGVPSSNNSKWKLMTNDFKYIITQAIFGKYAQFGSFVINGDWLICTNGTINGTAYNTTDINNPSMYNGAAAYTWFDPAYPWSSINGTHSVDGKQWSGYNFVPNFAVNGLTGDTYQNNAHIKGYIEAMSGSVAGWAIQGNVLKSAEDAIELDASNKQIRVGRLIFDSYQLDDYSYNGIRNDNGNVVLQHIFRPDGNVNYGQLLLVGSGNSSGLFKAQAGNAGTAHCSLIMAPYRQGHDSEGTVMIDASSETESTIYVRQWNNPSIRTIITPSGVTAETMVANKAYRLNTSRVINYTPSADQTITITSQCQMIRITNGNTCTIKLSFTPDGGEGSVLIVKRTVDSGQTYIKNASGTQIDMFVEAGMKILVYKDGSWQ